MFKDSIDKMGESEEKAWLEKVLRLYGLWQVEELQGWFLKCKLRGV
jgi:acyl-CoA oxidase